MREYFRQPPVLIIGMHRSGTTMISSMLEQLGLFLGSKKDDNYEAAFFHGINAWILRQCGGAWDHPAPVLRLFDCGEVRNLSVDYMRYLLKTPRAASFLGWGRYLSGLGGVSSSEPWGWKDPCTTVTLPLWLELFPGAKVIHIRRHGVDVAKSLAVRQRKLLAANRESYPARKAFYWLRPKKGGFTDTLRCADLEGGFSLWEEYLCSANRLTDGLGERLLELKYEEFLGTPMETLTLLATFCGLDPDPAGVSAVAAGVKRERSQAYLEDLELQQYAGRVKERLSLHGY